MAVAFGNTSLFHKVKDINLFAAEAQYYDIDFVIIPFSEHQNYKKKLENNGTDTDQAGWLLLTMQHTILSRYGEDPSD